MAHAIRQLSHVLVISHDYEWNEMKWNAGIKLKDDDNKVA